MNCVQVADDELVEKYITGRLESPLRDDFEIHLLECPRCQQDLEMLERIRSGLTALENEIRAESGSTGKSRAWLFPLRVAGVTGLASLVVVVAIVGARFAGRHRGGQSTAPVSSVAKAPPTSPEITALPPEQLFPEIGALPAEEQLSVSKAIINQNISLPTELAELRGKQETLLGASQEGASFRAVSPVGEVVLDSRPLFLWTPVAGASGYSVSIFDAKLNLVQSSPALHAFKWRTNQQLRRGRIYLWQVKATLVDGRSLIAPSAPSPEAKFRILDEATVDKFEQFRHAHPDAHLVLGILYAQAGLMDDAQDELKQLPENDTNYPLAQQLLKSIGHAH